jgi:hypothetical protein
MDQTRFSILRASLILCAERERVRTPRSASPKRLPLPSRPVRPRKKSTRALSLYCAEKRAPVAARYALRRALLELGPSGHPFEDFISHLYRAEGWRVETRKILQGKCVPHETDFYASHPERNEYLAAELKYHNDPGYKTDLKIALYVKSRFDDIFACDPAVRTCPIDRGLLVTNTKFTSEAIAYATCAGVELLGWGYPADDSLFMRMSRAKIYPIPRSLILRTL